MPQFQLEVNGADVTAVADDPAMPLLYFLRNDLGLHGPRFGCGLGRMRRLHGAHRRSGRTVVCVSDRQRTRENHDTRRSGNR